MPLVTGNREDFRSSFCRTGSTLSGVLDTSSFFRSRTIVRNPSAVKGVLFDTNRSYDEDSVWEMMEKSRVAAYGEIKYVVEYLSPGDIVFFYHKWVGLVAAGEVRGQVRKEGDEEQYRDVRFITPVPKRDEGLIRAMPASEVTRVTGRNFFWARTIKVPYLD